MRFPFSQQPAIKAATGQDGRTSPGLGPSDSTDSASDLPLGGADTDSDAQGTGERESTDPFEHITDGADIGADSVVDEDGAGLSHARPEPTVNGREDE